MSSAYRLLMPAAMFGFCTFLSQQNHIKIPNHPPSKILLQYYPDPLVRSSMSVDPLVV